MREIMSIDEKELVVSIIGDLYGDLFTIVGEYFLFKDFSISTNVFYIHNFFCVRESQYPMPGIIDVYQIVLREDKQYEDVDVIAIGFNVNKDDYKAPRKNKGILIFSEDAPVLNDDSCAALYNLGIEIKVGIKGVSYDKEAIMRRWTINNIMNE